MTSTPAFLSLATGLALAALSQTGFAACGEAPPERPRPPQSISERECNDSQGWADRFTAIAALPAGESASGISATAADHDWFSLTLPSALGSAFALHLTLSAGTFVLYSEAGSVIGDSASIGSLVLPLPAGTYGIRVSQANGPYTLTYAASAYVMPVLGVVPTKLTLATSERKLFRVDVVGGPRLVTVMTSNGFPGTSAFGLDVSAWNGGKLFTITDSSFGAGFPAYRGVLPPGSYRFHLFETIGTASTVDVSVTQGPLTTLPVAPIGSSVSANFVGEETKIVYQFTLPSAGRVTFTTAGGAPPAVSDTRLYLLDARFDLIAFNEDAPFSFYSLLGLSLPAGSYYLVAEPFPSDSGNVVVTGTPFTAVAPTVLRAGPNRNRSVPANGAALFSYDPYSPSEIDYTVSGSGTFEPVVVLLDAQGRLLGSDRGSGPTLRSAFVGARSAAHFAMVTEFGWAGGSVDVFVRPKLYTEPNGPTRRLVMVDKVQRSVALFLATSTNPGLSFPPIEGIVCIGPVGIVAGPSLTIPNGQGVVSINGYPNVTGVLFTQNVSVDLGLGRFEMTNLVD